MNFFTWQKTDSFPRGGHNLKKNRLSHNMEIKKKISSSNTPYFFSKEMIITKKSLNQNQLKFTYQKQLISDLDNKHKEWSKSINCKF